MSAYKSLYQFTGLGFQMMIIIGGFSYLGYWLDAHFLIPMSICTILCALLGISIAFYQVFSSLKNIENGE